MQQLTKIVATVGPNVFHKEGIQKLIESGVSVFRFNFKHNNVEWHSEGIKLVHDVSKELNIPTSVLIDLQGPSIRINMPTDDLSVKNGEKLYFGQSVFDDQLKGFSLTHPSIIESLENGQRMLADDGNFVFEFVREGDKTYAISQQDGLLKNKKAFNIPGSDFDFPVLVERDFEGLKVAARAEVDYIALSFVRSGQDIVTLRDEMKKFKIDARVISKIETKRALDHLDEIIEESDGIMVARGDLGVELPFEEVPYYQKEIIYKCIQAAKPVITATQMLNSMIEEPIPTRAEVSDVANAIYDLTDAIMLSGETAFGKYPYKSVEAMRRIAVFNERKLTYDIRKRYDIKATDSEAQICEMAYNLYVSMVRDSKIDFGGFIAFTQTGRTIRLLSRYRPRPDAPIFALAQDEKVRDLLPLNFGVVPFAFNHVKSDTSVKKDDILHAVEFLKEKGLIKKGQHVIALYGDTWAEIGGTSTVKLIQV